MAHAGSWVQRVRSRKSQRAPETARTAVRRGRGGQVWKGNITFGLVNIPVALRPAEKQRELRMKLVDRRDMAPVGYKKVNKETGAEVGGDEVVKAYDLGGGRLVALSEDDFERASPELTELIEIESFVDAKDIPLVYFDRPYFLEPEPRSEKTYALLREAMRRAGKIGLARVVLRARQHLAAVMVQGSALILELLRFQHELRDPSDLRLPPEDLRVTDAELEMAGRLIDGLAAPWRPETYKDDYYDKLLSFIREIAEKGGGPAPAARRAPRAPMPSNIMNLLKESVRRAEGGVQPARKHGRRRARHG
jgi:DNA end-binding protein Ku